MSVRRERRLVLCRNRTEACLLAAAEGHGGLALTVPSRSGAAEIAFLTIFGSVRTSRPGDLDSIVSIACDTLRAGERDVFLHCNDDELAGVVAERVRIGGWQCTKATGDPPVQLADPFAAFEQRRTTSHVRTDDKGRGWVVAFASAPLEGRRPLQIGDVLRLRPRRSGAATEVVCVAADGRVAGTCATVLRLLAPEEAALVGAVSARVMRTALGHGRDERGRPVITQVLTFEVPASLEDILWRRTDGRRAS